MRVVRTASSLVALLTQGGVFLDDFFIDFVAEYGAVSGAGNESTNATAWSNLVTALNAGTTRSGLRAVYFKKGYYPLNTTVNLFDLQHVTFIFEGGAAFNETLSLGFGCYWVWTGAANKFMFMVDTASGTNQNGLRWIGCWNMGSSNTKQGWGLLVNNTNNWGGADAALAFPLDGTKCLQRGITTWSTSDNAHGVVGTIYSDNIEEGAIYCEGGGFNAIAGNISHDDNQIGVYVAGNGQRSVSDMVTNGTTTITSATAAFNTGYDRGRPVSGTDIPAHAYIASVTNATTAVLSVAATGSHSGGSLTIGSLVPGSEMKLYQGLKIDGGSGGGGGAIGVLCYGGNCMFDGGSFEGYVSSARSVSDMVTNATTTITSATAAFTSNDAPVGIRPGRTVSGTNIPNGTRIASVTNSTTAVLDTAATGSGSGGSLTISNYSVGIDVRRVENNNYSGRNNILSRNQFTGHPPGDMVPWRITQAQSVGSAFGNSMLGAVYTNTVNFASAGTSDPIAVPNGYGVTDAVIDYARFNHAGAGP